MRRLLTATDTDFLVQLLFAALTGVRAEELHALRWKHLELEKGEVHFESCLDQYDEDDTTKTIAGIWTALLGATLLDEADLKPETVQIFAWHPTRLVTVDRYGHLIKFDDHRPAVDLIGRDVESVQPQAPETS